MSYTKGPWIYVPAVTPEEAQSKGVAPHGPLIQVPAHPADLLGPVTICVISEHNTEADARLIAAAPDLLDACQYAWDQITAWESVPFEELKDEWEPALRALAKAMSKAIGEKFKYLVPPEDDSEE